MKTSTIICLSVVFIILSACSNLFAQEDNLSFRYYSDYMYLVDNDRTRFDEIHWFWQSDIVSGQLHSNSQIGIHNNPTFYSYLTTSADEFYHNSANPYFAYAPVFNWPEAIFPDNLNVFEAEAISQGFAFENQNDQYQFRCLGDANGWNWYKWNIGEEFDPDNVIEQGFIEYDQDLAIYFNGALQIASESVSGTGTIGCETEMRIIDNLKYADVNLDSIFIPDHSLNKYGYMCNGDIIVMNTVANGRGNGGNLTTGHDSANVVLTGSFLALNERFSFDQQNDDWDEYIYCSNGVYGPDYRGELYLIGSLANKRRGYLHRSNCGGTGYGKIYKYESGLPDSPPPYFPEIEWSARIIDYPETFVDEEINLGANESFLVIGDGELNFAENVTINKEFAEDENSILIRSCFGGTINIYGDAENRVSINLDPNFEDTVNVISVDGQYLSDQEWTGLEITGNIFSFQIPDYISESRFEGNVVKLSTGNGDETTYRLIENSSFRGQIIVGYDFPWLLNDPGISLLKNCVIHGGIYGKVAQIDRCLFLPDENIYPIISTDIDITTSIRNSYFYSPNHSIDLGYRNNVDYCAYNTNSHPNPISGLAIVGEHMLEEVDPMFVDYDNGDYHLLPGSPLIDAGDPESGPDPDGTVADIGAFYFNQLAIEESEGLLPDGFMVSEAYPNPFNSSTKIHFELDRDSNVIFTLYDIMGREVKSLVYNNMSAGSHESVIDLSLQPSGIYFLNVKQDGHSIIRKLYYIK